MGLVRDGWQLNSTDLPTLRVEERPPTLVKQLIRESLTEFQFFKHVLSTPISINGHATSFIDLLRNTIKTNVESRHPGQESKNLYTPISEDEVYKSIAIKLMQGLETRGRPSM